jgi:hypothetical protein
VVVGTKVRLPTSEFGRVADAVATSLEGSLARLSRDCVDIFHLHNAISDAGGGDTLSVRQVLEEVVPAFERLRQQGKARFLGLTAIGDTPALHRLVDERAFDSAQVLNPSAATELPPNYPAQLLSQSLTAGASTSVGPGAAPRRAAKRVTLARTSAPQRMQRRCAGRPVSRFRPATSFCAREPLSDLHLTSGVPKTFIQAINGRLVTVQQRRLDFAI